MVNLTMIPIPSIKKDFGMYQCDLDRIGAKEGDWLGVRYGTKTIDVQAREVDKTGMPEKPLVWINGRQEKELGLPANFRTYSADMPPTNIEVTVWKHGFTKNKMLFPAVITVVLLLVGIALKVLSEGDVIPAFSTYFDYGLVVLAVIGALQQGYAVLKQKQ